jgi:hypothetical protein
LRDEGFSCSLDVLYGGLGIIAILDQKIKRSKDQKIKDQKINKFSAVLFFNIWSSKPWIHTVFGFTLNAGFGSRFNEFASGSGFNESGSITLEEGKEILSQIVSFDVIL